MQGLVPIVWYFVLHLFTKLGTRSKFSKRTFHKLPKDDLGQKIIIMKMVLEGFEVA